MRNIITSRIFAIALSLIAAFALSACIGGGSSEPTRYFTLAVEKINMPQANPSGKRIQIRKFTIDQAYQRNNIVYRESAYDFSFYDLDLWASRPEYMVMQVASQYLEKSGLFASVESKATAKPDFELLGHIEAIEEVDEGSSQYAHLAIQLTFRKTESETPLWQETFDDKMSMDSREPKVTAQTVSKLLSQFMEKALEGISQSGLSN